MAADSQLASLPRKKNRPRRIGGAFFNELRQQLPVIEAYYGEPKPATLRCN